MKGRKKKRATLPPGEGERRAQRGYVPQYDIAARLIYDALAQQALRWIGVADRGAGAFDDIVLGLADRVAAYQVKTKSDPQAFSIRTLLLGAANVLDRMAESWRLLSASASGAVIEITYVCDDHPSSNDDIGATVPISSAAFLRAHSAHRLEWRLDNWRRSTYAPFIAEIQSKTGLSDSQFEQMWRHTRFVVARDGHSLGLGPQNLHDDRRLQDIAALIPRLVADSANRDRWTLEELLDRLGWRSLFRLRHGHAFPVDALHEKNDATRKLLQEALATAKSGYVSLVGPPGCGKSTLLAAGLLPTPRATIVRYLAFVPGEGQDLGRAEATDFLHDLITQLKDQGLGPKLVPGSTLDELRGQFQSLLQEAGDRFRTKDIRTLIVVDGLDHVPREERPENSFLRVLPLPQVVPDGVLFVLGTQRLNIDDIPPRVRDQAAQTGRQVVVTKLSREAVSRLAALAGIPADVDHGELYARCEGHPLSTRYIITALVNANTPEARAHWLQNGPAYAGDVEIFYEQIWHDLEGNLDAQRAMAYIALSEGPISPMGLDRLVGEKATDTALGIAKHLLIQDRDKLWSIFHNSFRLFLRARAALRHGVIDQALIKRRYNELADMARHATAEDPQRWLELRYRARAGDHDGVAILAKPERFRSQFIAGRNPSQIHADMDFAMAAAGSLSRPDLVLDLILAREELIIRVDALGDDVFRALLALGDLRAAAGILEGASGCISVGKGYELVDALLEHGDGLEARKVFDAIEPINKLLGTEPLDIRAAGDIEIEAWSERALVFRAASQFLACLSRLRSPDQQLVRARDLEEQKRRLKLLAARGQLFRNPELSVTQLARSLGIGRSHFGLLHYFAASGAFEVGLDDLASSHLSRALPLLNKIGSETRRDAALTAAQLGHLALAREIIQGLEPPSFATHPQAASLDDFKYPTRRVLIHARLRSWIGLPFEAGAVPQSALLSVLQTRLETIGRLQGDALAKRKPHVEPIREFRSTLEFLELAEGPEPHDSDRWRLDRVLDIVVGAMSHACGLFDKDTLTQFTQLVDDRLATQPGRLGQPSIRRAYAYAVYRFDQNSSAAERRMNYSPGVENTPGEQLSEAAKTARALVHFGLPDRARTLLVEMHADGLGYSLPAKKDPQYESWADLLARANDEDPAGRPERLRFLSRVLFGLSKTEGRSAASRLASTMLEEATQSGAGWARAMADLFEQRSLGDWSDIVGGITKGVAKADPQLAMATGIIYGRIGVPFHTEYDGNIYSDLISAAPSQQLQLVVSHAVSCLEADGHPEKRILSLEDAIEAAATRGLVLSPDTLTRWRAELPAPRSGESPEDPFFNARTLEDVATTLAEVGTGTDSYRAVRAFVRLAPRSDYDRAKALFDSRPILQEDDRSVEAIAQAAVRAGRQDDAVGYLQQLKELAKERGSWSGVAYGKGKLRYHRLDIGLRGEPARRSAFDAFVDDMAGRREPVSYLLADLGSVLELLSPRLSWADTWLRLQSYLTEFREFRIGADYVGTAVMSTVVISHEDTLAELLQRAFETTTSELTTMARTAAIELGHGPHGWPVTENLVRRLWKQGGYMALQSAQIVWECRELSHARASLPSVLQEMCQSDDVFIRRTAAKLCKLWSKNYPIKSAELPAFYKLEMPDNSQARKFDPPSGHSLTSHGLYTDDPYAWTWTIREPLELAADASGFDLSKLRMRAAQLMTRMGGTALFGPTALDLQQRRLRRLSLHLPFRKLMTMAAFQAMREVVGELAAANAIDTDAIPFILRRCGGFSPAVQTLPPVPRPVGIGAAVIPDRYRLHEGNEWLTTPNRNIAVPTVGGHTVLAATSLHERSLFRDAWRVEQYYGPDSGEDYDELSKLLEELPKVFIGDQVMVLHDAGAPGAVVSPAPDATDLVEPSMLMLCPYVVAELNWRFDHSNAFIVRDANGEIAVRTLYWRDGGVQSRENDTGAIRHGYALIVRDTHINRLRPYTSGPKVARAWHIAVSKAGEERHAARMSLIG